MKHLLALVVSTAGIGLASCTHTVSIDYTPTSPGPHAETAQLPLDVALVISEEVSGYQYTKKAMGDTTNYVFGPPLVTYARDVTSKTFRSVKEFQSTTASRNQASAILIVRPRKADQTSASWAFGEARMSLIVEWTMMDASNQNLLWLHTIEGQAAERAGNMYTYKTHAKVLFQKLFDDLTNKTIDSFRESPELRKLTTSTSNTPL